ncbi:MAG: hypothetical protein EAX96_11220 [Candidatus Lokiarchaeota archaeon]|nr:hypothetical protein [Candidatus Lokiarchaeota archaeon]
MKDLKKSVMELVKRINLFAPLKLGQVIFKIQDDLIILIKKNKEINLSETIDESLPYIELIFNESENLEYLLEADDIKEYGDRLFQLSVIQKQVRLNINKIQDITKEGYYRFVSHLREPYRFEIIVPII